MRLASAIMLASLLLAGGCKLKSESEDPAAAAPSASAPVAAAATAAASASPAAFDPASVPEASASVPPFPMFKDLDGLAQILRPSDANRPFDRDYFIAGETPIAVEGKVFRGHYNLTLDRPYSSLEFRRNYEQAIAELGGRKIGGTVSTNPYRIKLQEAGAKPTGHCFIDPCDEADFYLIRQAGKEWWISVATGSFPLHGYVTVLEKQAMAKSYGFLDASALKSALDANGRVPIYIEFDVNRASLRPSARPAMDEVIKLMQQNAALKVVVEGHTDDTGAPARNLPLSLARAETVRAELIVAGIAPARMRAAGFGTARPLAQGTSEEARARNRRVELVKF